MRETLRLVRGFGGLGPSLVRVWRVFAREGLKGVSLRMRRMLAPPVSYRDWRAAFEAPLAPDDASVRLAGLKSQPLIDVLMAAYRSDLRLLDEAIGSVLAQSYPHWRLIIWDDGSQDAGLSARLAHWANTDARIRVFAGAANQGIAAAANGALAKAGADWITLLDHDDLLAADALLHLAEAIDRQPQARLIYSDEDKIDLNGARYEPHFKPAWSPEYLRGCNYLNHLTAARRADIEAIGGWRADFDGAQDHDLWLRLSERLRAEEVHHIPRVLYHWRAAPSSTASTIAVKPRAREAARAAVAAHLARIGQAGRVAPCDATPFVQVRRPRPAPAPKVTAIIPNRDQPDLLAACLNGLRQKTDYPCLDILIVDNQSVDPRTEAIYAAETAKGGVRVLRYDAPFNYSRMNNLAAAEAAGDFLLLLNNDVEAIEPSWLDAMAALAVGGDVGCVGAKLLYPDRTIQHAGVAVGVCGVAAHIYRGLPEHNSGPFGRLVLPHEVSAVTGACLLVRKDLYHQVGGLDEAALKIAFNDVDFCLKIRALGLRNLWTPHATLIHHESASRGYEVTAEKYARFQAEARAMARRWGQELARDPFYSPNLTVTREDASLRDPTARSAIDALLAQITADPERP